MEYEQDSEWQDVDEEIHRIVGLQEKAADLLEHFEKEWERLIIRKARIEERIENAT